MQVYFIGKLPGTQFDSFAWLGSPRLSGDPAGNTIDLGCCGGHIFTGTVQTFRAQLLSSQTLLHDGQIFIQRWEAQYYCFVESPILKDVDSAVNVNIKITVHSYHQIHESSPMPFIVMGAQYLQHILKLSRNMKENGLYSNGASLHCEEQVNIIKHPATAIPSSLSQLND